MPSLQMHRALSGGNGKFWMRESGIRCSRNGNDKRNQFEMHSTMGRKSQMGYYETARMQTKEKILQSFWHLYQTKKIEKISIRNITDACGIYRTTFYLYFPDIYAVLEEIESMLLQELDGVWKKSETDRETAYEELLYAMFQKNYEYLQVFLDETKQPDFSAKYKH